MISNEVSAPGRLTPRVLGILASDRGYWRWRFTVLDKHSPLLS